MANNITFFNTHTGTITVQHNGQELTVDAPIVNNKYLVGDDLLAFIGAAAAAAAARKTQVTTVLNADELLDYVKANAPDVAPMPLDIPTMLLGILQVHTDHQAQLLGFANTQDILSYVTVSDASTHYVPVKTFADWRLQCRIGYDTVIEKLRTGEYAVPPTIDEFIALLPTYPLS